jgi:hypothetical protein
MKVASFLGFSLCLVASLCYGADAGVVTVLDGEAKVLRGVTWYKLAEGARVQDGDVFEAGERTQIQLELARGDTVDMVGPGSLYVASAPREGKQPLELYMPQGWIKVAAKAQAAARLRAPLAVVDGSGVVAVIRITSNSFEVFVETGNARVSEAGRSGPDAAREARSGDFVSRVPEHPLTMAGAAPQSFVVAMPRHFMDTLPARAEKYRTARVELAAEHAITFAEAEPWLNGPYRRSFTKRLQPRLADEAFRMAAMANVQAYPEWSSVLAPQPSAKADASAKAAEKKDSTMHWPFSGAGR